MNKIGKILIGIGIIFLGIAIVLFLYFQYEEYDAGKKSANVLSVIKDNIENFQLESIDVEQVDERNSIQVNGYDYIGTLFIPSLNLELPVMSEYDEARLKIAPCRYYGSVATDNLILCAHSYKTHFGYLNHLKQKDRILFTNMNGECYLYEVLEIEILGANDVSLMLNTEFDLTLYTCTSDGMNRIVVRCNRVVENI